MRNVQYVFFSISQRFTQCLKLIYSESQKFDSIIAFKRRRRRRRKQRFVSQFMKSPPIIFHIQYSISIAMHKQVIGIFFAARILSISDSYIPRPSIIFFLFFSSFSLFYFILRKIMILFKKKEKKKKHLTSDDGSNGGNNNSSDSVIHRRIRTSIIDRLTKVRYSGS